MPSFRYTLQMIVSMALFLMTVACSKPSSNVCDDEVGLRLEKQMEGYRKMILKKAENGNLEPMRLEHIVSNFEIVGLSKIQTKCDELPITETEYIYAAWAEASRNEYGCCLLQRRQSIQCSYQSHIDGPKSKAIKDKQSEALLDSARRFPAAISELDFEACTSASIHAGRAIIGFGLFEGNQTNAVWSGRASTACAFAREFGPILDELQ